VPIDIFYEAERFLECGIKTKSWPASELFAQLNYWLECEFGSEYKLFICGEATVLRAQFDDVSRDQEARMSEDFLQTCELLDPYVQPGDIREQEFVVPVIDYC
jgi:hypothetical protein